jgi:hypothetical protein
VPEDNDDFHGLLEDKVEAAPYPDISAELPGVELDEEEREFQTILDKPEPDFEIWPQPHCTTQGLMVTKQCERDKPEHLRLHTRYNEGQRSLKPMRTS